jgi:hypothetical protein
MVFACDSTVTPENGDASRTIAGKSDGGTARRSKKLLALYSFRRSGSRPRRALRTFSICLGNAPGGVGPSIVHFHRSQKEHVKGHSAPARKIVSACSIAPLGRRSSSTAVPCATNGSTPGFAERRLRMRRSASTPACVEVAGAFTRQHDAASRNADGIALRSRERCEQLELATPTPVESVAWRRSASRDPAHSGRHVRRSLP